MENNKKTLKRTAWKDHDVEFFLLAPTRVT